MIVLSSIITGLSPPTVTLIAGRLEFPVLQSTNIQFFIFKPVALLAAPAIAAETELMKVQLVISFPPLVEPKTIAPDDDILPLFWLNVQLSTMIPLVLP